MDKNLRIPNSVEHNLNMVRKGDENSDHEIITSLEISRSLPSNSLSNAKYETLSVK